MKKTFFCTVNRSLERVFIKSIGSIGLQRNKAAVRKTNLCSAFDGAYRISTIKNIASNERSSDSICSESLDLSEGVDNLSCNR
ncbi:MAG: hypothetical protein QF745_09125 [Planctomycetota bacterium]|nr:hypothetical protein [Planctomycetota bacterium]